MHKVDRKDAEQTVQHVHSDRGLFVAGAKCSRYENSTEPDLPMRTYMNVCVWGGGGGVGDGGRDISYF